MSQYSYRSLPKDELHVRLLSLLPGEGGTVTVRLQEARWSQFNGQYDAISYMWGPSEPTYPVVIHPSGECIHVRNNIWQFLLHYQQSTTNDRVTYLWIDSICINQGDLAEKSIQVAAMGSIFRGARRVLVWLGDLSMNATLTQRDIDEVLQIHYNPPQNFLRERTQPTELQTVNRLWLSRHEKPSTPGHQLYERLSSFLEQLCSHPYWLRLWIVQEIHLSRGGPQIIIGSLLLGNEIIRIFRTAVKMHGKTTMSKPTADESLARTAFVSLTEVAISHAHTSRIESKMDLRTLLQRYCLQACHDSRDRIYGLLGILKDDIVIEVDYRVETWILFLKVLKLVLDLSINTNADENASALGPVRWLSWALDIYQVEMHSILQWASIEGSASLFESSHAGLPPHDAHDASQFAGESLIAEIACCKLQIVIEIPKSRLWPEVNHMTGKSSNQQWRRYYFGDEQGQRFKYWLQGRLRGLWRWKGQTWVCLVDKQYPFPIAIQLLNNGMVKVVGYISGGKMADDLSPRNGSRWTLVQLPASIEEVIQHWFDSNISEIKALWLQKRCAQITLPLLQAMQLAELARKTTSIAAAEIDLVLPENLQG